MTDLRAILGGKYDETIEKVLEAIAGEVDYLGCGCCTGYDYDEAVKRTGHDERPYMAAHDALAAVLPDLLAEAWEEGYAQAVADHLLMYDNSDDTPNPYRPETITRDATDAPVTPAAPDATNPPPDPSAAATGPHSPERTTQ